MEFKDYQKTVDCIREKDSRHKERKLVIILGSGWGPAVDALMEVEGEVAYEDLPGFPVSTVAGHFGRLLWGNFAGVPIYCMQGRFHYYEGYSMAETTFPVRVFAALGIQCMFLTNAAGGLNPDFSVGDLMMIHDHMNFMGNNPLIGANLDEFGPRFPDMTSAWDKELQTCLESCAKAADVTLQKGIYMAVSGPSFETPAEIRAFATLGADAVGMSTVPECIVAQHCGMRVTGLSCITNLAAHIGGEKLSHEDVSKAAKQSLANVIALLYRAIPCMHELL